MIELKNFTAFAHGNHRAVYRHPSKPDRCLKVMIEDFRENYRWKKSSIISKLVRPRRYFQDNEEELHFSKQVRKKIGAQINTLIAEAHKLTESDLGPVLEVDLITDYDGQISLSLKEYLYQNGMTPECQKAIDTYWERLEEAWIFVSGRPDNLSLRREPDGSYQILAIDGYAFGQFIPLAKWFRSQQQRALDKRKRTQAREINKILKAKEHGQALTSNGFIDR